MERRRPDRVRPLHIFAIIIFCFAAPVMAQDGGALYEEHCASCHNRGVDRAPSFDVLRKMTPCSPAQSGAVSAIPGAAFSGSLDGHIRAYASDTGRVVWDFDTVREFETVNGVPARGGSLDGPGPVIAGGMMFVNSGYTVDGGMAGNVILAFSVDGR